MAQKQPYQFFKTYNKSLKKQTCYPPFKRLQMACFQPSYTYLINNFHMSVLTFKGDLV